MKNLFITLIICVSTIGVVEAQGGISFSNFNAEKISNSELLISIDYVLSEEMESKEIFIQANPVLKDGRNIYKEVFLDRKPLEASNHQVSFKISKKPRGKGFRSESIRVCVTESRSILLCEEFPFIMSWNETEAFPKAKIISFTSDNILVEKGTAVTLSWETENASKVNLGRMGTREYRGVPNSGSETVLIDETTTYVLMASSKSSKGAVKAESSKLKITVAQNQLDIGSFYASHPTIRRGIETKLLWNVYNADKVTLNGKPVEDYGDLIVSPKRTTRYTLRAKKDDNIVEEFLSIYVTPFGAPKLSDPLYSLEICKKIETKNGYSKCISSDGPFVTGDEIYIMARFKNLPKGKHSVKRITYRGLYFKDKWIKAHEEESSFQNPGKGEGLITFPIVNLGEGAKKLKIIINDNKETNSEIIYCIDCSRMWE
ncbi:hypothetical protein [Maribacter sp. HTCC2170]|uniref:hypothetical protein n=1 Tax=Maribacter sp. (strain HTCC2170 / KCCM 42371) TaxID=313603 RepID=UPI00006B47AB|nr:hypothetical protein [Maribacter sp. HTCC2170]EAR01998.1 hypothetical protein FB2170_15758 [Maribacter sp. HTCC2170]